MEEELELLWQKLSFIEEEGEKVVLGSNSTKAARELGKNCLVMKVLSRRCIVLDALRKNLRMVWKPNKSLQISEIDAELYMVEFGDERDKRKYGAWLRGELLWKSGREIAQTGSRGPLDRRTEHGNGRKENLEVVAREGGDKKDMALRPKEGGMGIGAELESTLPAQGNNDKKEKTGGIDDGGQKREGLHEIGKSILTEEKLESTLPILGNEFQKENRARGVGREEMQWEMETKGEQAPIFVFNMGPNKEDTTTEKRLEKRDIDDGPIAMTFSDELGWTAESLGPTSGHWKRIAREKRAGLVSDQVSLLEEKTLNLAKIKRESPTPLKELDPKALDGKRSKGCKIQKGQGKENSVTDGGVAALQPSMSLLAWNCRGLGSPPAVRILTDEVKSKLPILVFLVETKAGISKIKGFQNKIEYTEGIVVPSDGKSGGLAMIWRKGTEVRLKSCSNSHIDVVVQGENRQEP
nr:hypothetical protein CFP56_37888 [Quercus suber]